MKKLLFLLIALCTILVSCEPEPEFYIDGKPYYTNTYCVKSHTDSRYEYHYGYNWMSGKYEWHLGYHDVTVCDATKTDTIEIVKEK